MKNLPHAPGFTLAADAFLDSGELIGFSIAHHQLTVFSHFHEFYELALVLRGSGIHQTATGSQPVGRGCVVFVTPGSSHGWELCDDLLVYNCFMRVEAAQFDISWAQRDARLGRLFAPTSRPRAPIVVRLHEDAFQRCHTHLEAIRERAVEDRGEAFDLGHLLLALDIVARSVELAEAAEGGPSAAAPAVVRAAVELLERDLRQHWTLDALAGELCVGPFHLARLFKRWVGTPTIAFADRRRAERAALLLTGSDDAIASIGADVGWPDPSQFARRFRQEYRLSPRAYRARSRTSHGLTPPGAPQRPKATAEQLERGA